jgi:prepilin-type N-terminal cleavage/methylation domain-containing protein/prepilin-type processing-associated H-X9-DG protein
MSRENESRAVIHPILGQRRGFTLMELLVVIAILVLLMAILLPTLQRVRRQAKAVACQSNLHQWGLMFAMYTEANNGKWFSVSMRHPDWYYLSEMRPYYRDCKDVSLCPRTRKPPHRNPSGVTTFEAYYLPPLKLYVSYGWNSWVGCPDRSPDVTIPSGEVRYGFWTTPNIRQARNVPVYMDSIYYYFQVSPAEAMQPPQYDGDCDGKALGPVCINRHEGGINCLFMDWSVRKVGLKELWTLKWDRCFDTAGPWTKAGGVQPEDWPKWMRKFKDY